MITDDELHSPHFRSDFVRLFGPDNWNVVVADAPRRRRERENARIFAVMATHKAVLAGSRVRCSCGFRANGFDVGDAQQILTHHIDDQGRFR